MAKLNMAIIITLRRAQKFGDTGPYKNFDFLFNRLLTAGFRNLNHLASLKNREKLLSSYLPVSPSRVLRAPGTSPYHLVPKHLRATWPRPEQSHLLPEACSPDGTDKRRQRQRQTERPPPEPSNILKRFCALYDVEIRHYKKKVSKLF